MDLRGKITLVTGAALRVGQAIALTFARRGAVVIIHYRESRDEAFALKREIERQGGQAYVAFADFSVQEQSVVPRIQQFVRNLYHEVGRIDILINNAAIFYPTPLGQVTDGDWERFMNVNLKAPFFLAQEIGVRMKKQKAGKIINLIDCMALRPDGNFIPYGISKAGLIAATHGLAKALAPYVSVNGVAPGPILPSRGMTAKKKRTVSQRTLLRRFGNPCDIAETARFLCEDTDYITGAVIPVDGGASLV